MTWKDKARAVILDVMREARADGLDRAALIRRIDAAYPFGAREHYPYQAWLAVRRALLFGGAASPPTFRAGARRRPSEAAKLRTTGQRTLFDEEDRSQ